MIVSFIASAQVSSEWESSIFFKSSITCRNQAH